MAVMTVTFSSIPWLYHPHQDVICHVNKRIGLVIVSIRITLSSMVACMMLTGCGVTIDPSVGQGPITLSSDVEKAFADYKATQVPRYFAVSTDGQAYYYSFCDEGRCLRQVKTRVISECEVFSKGIPCKIYGSHGNIVWATQN